MISYIVESTNEYAKLKKSSFTTSFSEKLFFFTLFKFYALCDSATGYCLKLKIYTGSDITFDKTLPYNYSIVMDFISPNYLYNNHTLYIDNYYASLKLATDLNKKKINLIGTIKKNARYVPDMMSQKINIGEIIKLDGIVVCRFEI